MEVMTFRIEPELAEEIRTLAAEVDQTPSAVIRNIVKEKLEKGLPPAEETPPSEKVVPLPDSQPWWKQVLGLGLR